MSLTLYGHSDAIQALKAVEVEIAGLQSGARVTQGYTLDALLDTRANLRRIIVANAQFMN